MSVRILAVAIVLVGFSAGCPSCGGLTKECTEHPGDTLTVRGTVFREAYYGPPNYGEHPDSDVKEVADILRLDKPLVYVGADNHPAYVDQIQIIGYGGVTAGTHVTIKGQLDSGISGHHRRDVIIVSQ